MTPIRTMTDEDFLKNKLNPDSNPEIANVGQHCVEHSTSQCCHSRMMNHQATLMCDKCQISCMHDNWHRYSVFRHDCCCVRVMDVPTIVGDATTNAERRCSFNRNSPCECDYSEPDSISKRNRCKQENGSLSIKRNIESLMTNDIINGIFESNKSTPYAVHMTSFGKSMQVAEVRPSTVEIVYDQICGEFDDDNNNNNAIGNSLHELVLKNIETDEMATNSSDNPNEKVNQIASKTVSFENLTTPDVDANAKQADLVVINKPSRLTKAFKAFKEVLNLRRSKKANKSEPDKKPNQLVNRVKNENQKTAKTPLLAVRKSAVNAEQPSIVQSVDINTASKSTGPVLPKNNMKDLYEKKVQEIATSDSFVKCKLKSREKLLLGWDKIVKKASNDPNALKDLLKKQDEKATDEYKKRKEAKHLKTKSDVPLVNKSSGNHQNILKINPGGDTGPFVADNNPCNSTGVESCDSVKILERPKSAVFGETEESPKISLKTPSKSASSSSCNLKSQLADNAQRDARPSSQPVSNTTNNNPAISNRDASTELDEKAVDIEKIIEEIKDDETIEALKRRLSIYIKKKRTQQCTNDSVKHQKDDMAIIGDEAYTGQSTEKQPKVAECQDTVKAEQEDFPRMNDDLRKTEPEIQMFYFSADGPSRKSLVKTHRKLRTMYGKSQMRRACDTRQQKQQAPVVLLNFVTPFDVDDDESCEILHYCHHQNLFKTLNKPKRDAPKLCDCNINKKPEENGDLNCKFSDNKQDSDQMRLINKETNGRNISPESMIRKPGAKHDSLKSQTSIKSTKNCVITKQRRASKVRTGYVREIKSTKQILRQISLFVKPDDLRSSKKLKKTDAC